MKRHPLGCAAAIAVTLLFSFADSFAHSVKEKDLSNPVTSNGITIEKVWMRKSPIQAGNGAAYLEITNQNPKEDTLVGASCDCARKTELHTVDLTDGVMKMREVSQISAPSGQKTVLKPGGYHIMLIEIKDGLNPGNRLPLKLRFKNAGEIGVEALVQKISEHAPGASGHE